jgi:type IV secretory pathway protease TraF
VIALPGETVTIDFGEVRIDGQSEFDSWGVSTTFPEGEWRLGTEEWFVLSDNRSATRDDSRGFGPIPLRWAPTMLWRLQIGSDR